MVLAVMQDLASAVASRAGVRSQYSAAQAQIALDQIAHLTALIEIKKQAQDLDKQSLGAELGEHRTKLEHIISTRQQVIASEQAAQASLIAKYNQGVRSLTNNVEQALQDVAQNGNERMQAITEWMRIHQKVLKPLIDGFN